MDIPDHFFDFFMSIREDFLLVVCILHMGGYPKGATDRTAFALARARAGGSLSAVLLRACVF